MTPPRPDAASQKILELIKRGSGVVYPDLVLSASGLAEEHAQSGETPLTWAHFPLLGLMRASLNTIWGSLVLRDASPNTDIALYGCATGVGTTLLSFHMALFIALSQGIRTIYVDTDGDKPKDAAHPVGPTTLRGLAAYYFEDAPLEDCIHPTRVPHFYVLPSGATNAGQQEIQSPPVPKIRQLTKDLRERFGATVYDCPPIIGDPIGITFAQDVRHILLVSRYAVTRREVCAQTAENFRANNLDIAGVVLNQREYPIPIKLYNLLK